MKKICTLAALSATVFFLVNCSNKTGKAISGKPAKARSHFNDTTVYTPAQLNEGMALYKASCAECHRLHAASEFNANDWDGILVGMLPRTHLSESKGLTVRAYLLANAKKD